MTMQKWPTHAFLDMEEQYADFENARFVVLPIGYDASATYKKGSRFGPDAIIEASQHVDLFDEQLLDEFYQVGIYTHEHVIQDAEPPEQVQEKIYQAARPLVAQDKTLLSLGGDHSITPALVRAVQEKWPEVSVLHFDAHLDLKNSYYDSCYNHACALRRVHDLGATAVSIGVRSFDKWEYDFTKTHKKLFFTPAQVTANVQKVATEALSKLSDQVYITFDIDALDPSQAPGTGTPEAGGIRYREVLTILEAVGRHRRIVAADIVEVMPIKGQVVTESVAARLAYKIISFSQLYT
jgi:agmatinase